MVTLIKEASTNILEDDVIRQLLLNQKVTTIEEVLQDEDSFFIYNILKGIKEELSYIRLENEVFSYFLQKNTANSLSSVVKRDTKSARVAFSPKEKSLSFFSSRGSLGSSKYSIYSRDLAAASVSNITFERGINYVTKNDMAEKQVQDVEKMIKNIEEHGRRMLRSLRAHIAEKKIDMVDLDECLKSFGNLVLNSPELGSNINKCKISTERFLNYCYNWNNNAREFINTIRLRTGSLHVKALNQRAANARKRDLKGMLMPVDFDKIKIVREKHLADIEEQTVNLQGIKSLYGRVAFTLSMEKRNLIEAEKTTNEIQRAIDFTKNQVKKIKREIEIVEEETKNSREQLYELIKQKEDYVAPSFEDYFNMKLRLAMVEKEEKQLERQNYILGIKLQNYKIKLAKQKQMKSQD